MRERGHREFKLEELGDEPEEFDAEPDPKETNPEKSPQRRNRVLFEWLCDDGDRAALYDELQRAPPQGGPANAPSRSGRRFWSRTRFEDDPAPSYADIPKQGPRVAMLVTDRDAIEEILKDSKGCYSSRAYRALGSGGFMLGLDPLAAGPQGGAGGGVCWHALQRGFAVASMAGLASSELEQLAQRAVDHAMVLPLSQAQFDLAELAEEIAVRWCGLLFGFANDDHKLIREACAKAHRAITYQILGRHFVSEPDTVPAAQVALARLARRADELIREYDRLARYPTEHPRTYSPQPQHDLWPEGVTLYSIGGLSGFEPLLKRWALRSTGVLSGEQLATMAAGMLAGTVGNVQAAICIAVSHVLSKPRWKEVWRRYVLAIKPEARAVCQYVPRESIVNRACVLVNRWIERALRANPPVAFLSRIAIDSKPPPKIDGKDIPAETELVLCMGAATRGGFAKDWNPLLFGLSPSGIHHCVGADAARGLVTHAVTRILALPSLAETLDPVTLEPIGLEKRWGFACERYPLEYRRDVLRRQQPLQVIMRIKSPVVENAAALRQLIADGAPRVQQALDEARHVHFAWFQLVDGDTALALQTVYDGDFDSYLTHFALKVSDVFDRLFRYVEDAPPLPVHEFPEAFVETIRRYHRAPLGGYFFSAYPRHEVAEILRLAARGKRGP